MRVELIFPMLYTDPEGIKRPYSRKYYCSGQHIKTLSKINKYLVDDGDRVYFEYKADTVDHKKLRSMIEKFPFWEHLRFGEHKMLKDLQKFYSFNLSWRNQKAQENIKDLYESLMIYFLIKKYKDGK